MVDFICGNFKIMKLWLCLLSTGFLLSTFSTVDGRYTVDRRYVAVGVAPYDECFGSFKIGQIPPDYMNWRRSDPNYAPGAGRRNSAGECQLLCKSVDRCLVFMWIVSTRQCWLSSRRIREIRLQPVPGRRSGEKNQKCPDKRCLHATKDSRYRGPKGFQGSVAGANECISFYSCVKGDYSIESCPAGEYFNVNAGCTTNVPRGCQAIADDAMKQDEMERDEMEKISNKFSLLKQMATTLQDQIRDVTNGFNQGGNQKRTDVLDEIEH